MSEIYKNTVFYNNVEKLKNEEILDDDYTQLCKDTVSEWFYKKIRESGSDITICENDIDPAVGKYVDILLELPDKKCGLIFMYDEFTCSLYDEIITTLKQYDITPFFFMGHIQLSYTHSNYVTIPNSCQRIIDNNNPLIVINPISRQLNYVVDKHYDFLSNTRGKHNSVLTIDIDDCNFNPQVGFVFNGFNTYYTQFKKNVDKLHKEEQEEKQRQDKRLQTLSSDNDFQKSKNYRLIEKDISRKDYYFQHEANKHKNTDIYHRDGSINYGVLLRDLEDINDYDMSHHCLNTMPKQYNKKYKDVNFWKIYIFYRIIKDNVGMSYSFIDIFQLVKYGARHLQFTVSPAADLIHNFTNELAHKGYITQQDELHYVIEKDDIEKEEIDNWI